MSQIKGPPPHLAGLWTAMHTAKGTNWLKVVNIIISCQNKRSFVDQISFTDNRHGFIDSTPGPFHVDDSLLFSKGLAQSVELLQVCPPVLSAVPG